MKPIIILDDLSTSDTKSGAGFSIAAIPALNCNASMMNDLLHLGGGPVRVIVVPERADLFQLEAMNNRRAAVNQLSLLSANAHTELISVEARTGVHSGISAADRAATVAVLGSINPNPRDLVSPGHVFPRLGASGGLLERPDPYEAALEIFAREVKVVAENDADYRCPAACVELFNEAGEFASQTEVRAMAGSLGLRVFSLTEIVRERLESSPLIKRVAESELPLAGLGTFNAVLFRDRIGNREHLALVRGPLQNGSTQVPTVRIHRKAMFEDIFGAGPNGSARLQAGLERIAEAPCGVFLYLDVVPGKSNYEPMRDYAIGAQILVDLGVTRANIITDSTNVTTGSTIFGVKIVGQQRLTTRGSGATEKRSGV